MASIIDTLEKTLMPLGLMEGPNAVPYRMLVGAVIGGLVVTYIKPQSMFQGGMPRPWSFFETDPESGIAPTSTPWYIGPVAGAVLLGVFV